MVDDVDEAYGLAGIDKFIGNLLSLVVIAVVPVSKVYDRDAGLFGSCVPVCLMHYLKAWSSVLVQVGTQNMILHQTFGRRDGSESLLLELG